MAVREAFFLCLFVFFSPNMVAMDGEEEPKDLGLSIGEIA